MERKSIAIEDTWDLSRIYANKQEFYTDLEKRKIYYHLCFNKRILFRKC